ncbi:complement factor H-like isoform X2 [Melanotaenia boesemani]|uniref:complement factor H-like isoform X2 n=1 Tax=Melanotaenia boesemani TaxID=1250792 RepID=UPI001C0593D7|nr:complement factor H-like isoform X2 [Melanotaenia boesemani]
MCVRYLGFVLLAWLLEVFCVSAQIAAHPCAPPALEGGYFIPEQNEYPHEATLIYACDAGRKPVAEGWWATSSCQNGKWSHEPQCVKENSCFQPTIPHGTCQKRWYEENDMITVTCHKGYELKHGSSNARCMNGRWSSLPVCEKQADACGEPAKIPHAVIIYQEPQDVFASDSELQFECKDGFESKNIKTLTCKSGSWFGSPLCRPQDRSPSQLPPGERQDITLTPRQPSPARYCVMHPDQYYQYGFRLPSAIHLYEGQTQYLFTSSDCHIHARCANSRVSLARCCASWDVYYRQCVWYPDQ